MTDRNQIQAVQSVKKYTTRNTRRLFYGTLGNNAGTVDHATRTDWVYLRLHGDSNQVVEAYAAASFPHVAEIVVDVELVQKKGAPYYQVLGVSSGIAYNDTWTWAGTVGEHAEQHQRRDRDTGGFDPLDIYNRALVNLRARAQAVPDLTLYVERGFYVITSFKEFAGGNSPAFTAPAGAFSTQRWDLLYLGNDDALHVLQGTAAPINPVYPTVPANCIPIAYVILSNSSTSIIESMITDARTILSSNQATATAHNLLSAVHTDTTTAAAVRGDIITAQGIAPLWTRLAISVPAATMRNLLGVDNGDTESAWKSLYDATSPDGIVEGTPSATGSSLYASRVDHAHGAPATWTAKAHNLLSAIHGDATAAACVRGDLVVGIGASPKWTRYAISVPAANVLNVLGVANGDTEPTWKTLFDATAPADTGTAAAGTSLSAAHRDHVHALATPGTLTVSTSNSATAAHTHAITSSAAPGAAASLLATNASGGVTLTGASYFLSDVGFGTTSTADPGGFGRYIYVQKSTGAAAYFVANDANKYGFFGFDGTYGYFGTSGSGTISRFFAAGAEVARMIAGIQVGSPTGGDKGAGTINTAGDIYKNNSAYTNPDFAIERWATGKIEKYADRPRAKDYQRMTIGELEQHIRTNYRLPGITDEPTGMFERGDIALEKIEELTTYLIELYHEIESLKKQK